MANEKNPLLGEIEDILRNDPSRMFSREEILNLLAQRKRDAEIEHLLAELEVSSTTKEENPSDVYATCRGGTVYYKWNKTG
ncbi:MAG: hypothetical protein ACRD99_06785 [Nitrososphaera sp.]